MEQTQAHEIVRRVEEAPLRDLLRVSVDEVQTQMDSYLDPSLNPLALYRRWERQQWAVADLDLSEDTHHWERLDEGQRDAVRRTMILFFIGEQAVTDTLSPILHAAPHEDERIFLATQIADEARHAVFFQRYFDEVLGIGGGLHAALERVGPEATAGFRRIFDLYLATASERVRTTPNDRRAWVEAVVTYHLIIEGYLALAGQRNLLRFFRAANLLPGFTTGFTAVARDESRHVGFGVLALRRRLAEDPGQARTIARCVLELSEATVLTVVNPEHRLRAPDPARLPTALRQSPLEARDFSIGSLARRLHSIGLDEAVVGQIQEHYRSLYDQLWARYEEIHGVEHPVRWYQRQGEAS